MVKNQWARIQGTTVAEVTHINPEGRFPASLTWVACPANTVSGMKWSDGTFSIVPPTPPNHVGHIAAVRYKHETAGITVNAITLETRRDSQALITAAALSAVLDPNYTCTWKALSGPVELNAAQLIDLSAKVRAHVQACFERELQLLDHLAKGTYTPDMLHHGWPTAKGT